jgi:hypothetical protein
MDQIFRVFSVPADGTGAATVGNGDFGTSPIFGQLSGKLHQLALWLPILMATNMGRGTPKHNEGLSLTRVN